MKTNKYEDLIQFVVANNSLVPYANYVDLINDSLDGELIYMQKVKARDLKLHRCYFSLLSYIYNYLPANFQKKVPEKIFYKWLQTLKGEYKVLFEFKDGRQITEYESISFSKMDEYKFRNYIKEQLPYIYENIIRPFYDEETYNSIISTIESEYEKFMIKLYSIESAV